MVDIVDRETRSRMMSRIRGKNTKPERLVRSHLHRRGLRFRLHVRDLPGTPDLVLPKYRAIIEVHGCFWHQHPGCPYAVLPSSNGSFWREKLARNRERDAENHSRLREAGWRVFVVWECELSEPFLEQLVQEIRKE